MSGKFHRRPFSAININDPFFDSLKADYPGTLSSPGFSVWFNKKSREGRTALVFEDDIGLGAFISLKMETGEPIDLQGGFIMPEDRIKISTIKIDQRYQHQRIGEGALGLVLWEWRDSGLNQIYVTVFDKHVSLISLLTKYGFWCIGYNNNGEGVYIKDRRHLDFNDPCKSFPFINGNLISQAGCLAINMEYHDTMFAYSDLANTLQERIDISVANGLKKVYIGNAANVAIKAGQPVLIYRRYTGDVGKPSFKSVITSYCIATRVEQIKFNGRVLYSLNDFLSMIGNKSVFDRTELTQKYNGSQNLILIELVYFGYFGAGNNVNYDWLQKNGCWFNTHPMNFRYTKDKFETILRAGRINVDNVIVY